MNKMMNFFRKRVSRWDLGERPENVEGLRKALKLSPQECKILGALRAILEDTRAEARRAAEQPDMAGRPEATHANGGAFWIARVETKMRAAMEAGSGKRERGRDGRERAES